MTKFLCLTISGLLTTSALNPVFASNTNNARVPDAKTAILIVNKAEPEISSQVPLGASLVHESDGDYWHVHIIKPSPRPGQPRKHGGGGVWVISKQSGKIVRHISFR